MADNQRPDGVDKRVAEDIAVPSQDPAGKENKEKTFDPKGKQVDGKKETKEEEMVSRGNSIRGRCAHPEELTTFLSVLPFMFCHGVACNSLMRISA